MRLASLVLLAVAAGGCTVKQSMTSATARTTRATAAAAAAAASSARLEPTIAEPKERWAIVEQLLPKGAAKDGVYTVTVPRDDLHVSHLDLGDVPAAAGIESAFHLFLCPCGKTSVVGRFCLLDHEINDVVDELRAAHVKVASVGPMMLSVRPSLYVLHFHGEGDVERLAKALKAALEWTGN